MKFGSVCSGIEAASVAWNQIGWEAAWFSEIEPFPSALLNHYYPDTPNLGDMTTLPDRIESGEVEAPDVFCGGTPCQAFSLAGQRKSLADARGNLSLTFCEIADAIDSVRSVRGLPPAIVFWENVPGVLSTADNAFGCFLAQLCGGDEPLVAPDGWPDAGVVSGPKRTVAWRVLDAQYFGVAQRRRRVFVVASARNDFDPAAVLLEFDGVRRDSAPSREAGEITPTLTKEGTGVSRPGHNEDGWYVAQPEIAMCLNAGAMRRQDGESETFIAKVSPCIDASFGRLQGCSSQDANHGHSHLISFHPTQDPISNADICHSIGANENATAAVMQPVAIQGNLIGREAGGPQGVGASQEGVMYTLTKMDVHGVAQPINFYGGNKRSDRPEGGFYVRMDEDTSKTLDAALGLNPTCSQDGTAVMQPIPIDTMNHLGRKDSHSFGDFEPGAPSYTLTKGHSHAAYVPPMQVRRLTPTECERLQGFPDGYTAIPWRGKSAEECPDGPRYKVLGNSWAVPVVTWIGKRIQKNLA
jgi:DNA (cytosine-5)-methyltransferase 1